MYVISYHNWNTLIIYRIHSVFTEAQLEGLLCLKFDIFIVCQQLVGSPPSRLSWRSEEEEAPFSPTPLAQTVRLVVCLFLDEVVPSSFSYHVDCTAYTAKAEDVYLLTYWKLCRLILGFMLKWHPIKPLNNSLWMNSYISTESFV